MINLRNLLIGLFIVSCAEHSRTFEIDDSYLTKFDSITSQMSPNRKGYIQLVGLFELNNQTPNRFGSDSKNEHILTVPGTPPLLGYLFTFEDSIHFQAAENVVIKNEAGDTITDSHLPLNEYGNSDPLYYGRLKWIVKTFGQGRYLRVWDLENPEVKSFEPFSLYPPTAKFIFESLYRQYDQPKEVMVTTSMAFNDEVDFVGSVSFQYNEAVYTLEVEEGGFLMFADETSGVTTYGSGRYLYLSEPDSNGTVVLDFNYAYNPPCSYSTYTTCRFPPPQNRLPFAVEAGEKIARLD